MSRRSIIVFLAMLFAAPLQAQPRDIFVRSAHGNLREAIAHRQVVRPVSEYTLFNWLFTDSVMIDENAQPHPFPILTLNAKYIEDDPKMLAEFINLEIEWYLAANKGRVEQYIKEMMKRPDALVPGLTEDLPPDSLAYITLLVCAMEYQAINDVLGPTALEELMVWRLEGRRKAIYAAVEKHAADIMGQAVRFRLVIPPR